jgi:succinate-semialdehyde dehydrogenase / glutarate-semialdehyde dehydrogenase
MILENVKPGMPAYEEELFGPVFTIHRFTTLEEAVDLANDIKYGLSGNIFTTDIQKAKKVATMLEVGNVYINEIAGSSPDYPTGGVKDSGFGRECYKDGLLETCNRKTVAIGKLY